MFVKIFSASVHGIDGHLIEVEVDIRSGLPMVAVVGLPDSAVRESVERVRAAIQNAGMKFPLERITINLAPADLRKVGSAFDLAIAAGILIASGQVRQGLSKDAMLIGELSLDGQIRMVPGVLPMTEAARAAGLRRMIVPRRAVAEAKLIPGIEVVGVSSLAEWIEGAERADPGQDRHGAGLANPSRRRKDPGAGMLDLSDVVGQAHGKRALIIAAAGMHNILFVGPPGTGKTMLCNRLPTLLPPLDDEEALSVTKIYSVCGKLGQYRDGLIRHRPFRSPHHTISAAGLIGGGSVPKPGEITLAHHGVLFLDELPEFSRSCLEALRQPLEEHEVTVARTRGVSRFPAQFLMAASMNPCFCGLSGGGPEDPQCTCTPVAVAKYRARMSGPLSDRIDLQVELPRQSLATPVGSGLSSADAREMIADAEARQLRRYASIGLRRNSELNGQTLKRFVVLSPDAESLLRSLYEQLGLSYRAHDRILKVSRTIADLAGKDKIGAEDIAEASSYRCLDRA